MRPSNTSGGTLSAPVPDIWTHCTPAASIQGSIVAQSP
jgi:hypothetical protein